MINHHQIHFGKLFTFNFSQKIFILTNQTIFFINFLFKNFFESVISLGYFIQAKNC